MGTGIAYGYQLFARQPATGPEVYVDGRMMTGIARWGELHTVTRLTGDWEITWRMIRATRKRLQRHSAFHYGAPVDVRFGPIPVAVGSLTEPDWDSGDMTALGAPRQAEDAQCFTAAMETTTKPNTAIDQAIARGVLNWTRRDTFGTAKVGQDDDASTDLKSVARLLDAWAEEDGHGDWRVDRRRMLRIVDNSLAAQPDWMVTPGVGELGVASDDRIDRVFIRYLDSTSGAALTTASWPAASPAGGVERGWYVGNRGPITPTKATNIAKGIWKKMNGESGWTNGITATRSQVTTFGGQAANLALIKAGDTMRLLGVPDPRGLGHNLDVVIGETDYDWAAGEIQLNPVGLAASSIDAIVEDISPGATAL